MKVLIVNNLATMHGGAEAMIAQLKSGLTKEGHEVRVLCGNEKGNGAKIADAKFVTCSEHISPLRPIYLFNPFAILALRRELRTFRPDIVHLHTISKASPFILPLLKGYPTALTLHDHSMFDPTRVQDVPLLEPYRETFCDYFISKPSLRFYLEKLRFWALRLFARNVNAVLACSDFYASCARDSGIFPRIETIHNGIDLPAFSPIASERNVLFVGRLSEEKGVPVLVKAAGILRKAYPDMRVDIVGGGRQMKKIGKMISKLELKDTVHLLGYKTGTEIAGLYRESSLVVVPSVSPDNLPTVCIEAMGSGRPIVASRIGGLPELVEDGKTGFLVPPDDSEALAASISQLLSDPKLMQEMGKAGREKAEMEFAADVYIENTLAEYEKIRACHKKNMKIMITNAYAKGSGGDMAILSSLISEMRRVFDRPDITVASIDDLAHMRELFPDVRSVSSLITTIWDENASRVSKLLALMRNWIAGGLWALSFRLTKKRPDWLLIDAEKESMNRLADADLVVGVGGGYIREFPGFMKIVDLGLTLRMLILSLWMGKTTVLYSQSIGPFGNRYQQKLAGYVLRKMRLIITRESISTKLLLEMGVEEENLVSSVDAAFLVRGQNPESAPLPPEFKDIKRDFHFQGPLIGVTARAWLGKEAQDNFEKQLARALDIIAERYDAHIVFIPQATIERHADDDRIVQKRVWDEMAQKDRATNLRGAYDFRTLLSIYENLDFMIGTRFHSAIFSLTARVPALVIAYEHKAVGIMEDLGLGKWVVEIDKLSGDEFAEMFDGLYRDKDAYLRTLQETLPDYIAKAESSADMIEETYLASKDPEKVFAVDEDEAKT
jgi:colanic acid/amylovoran biosynthesis protein